MAKGRFLIAAAIAAALFLSCSREPLRVTVIGDSISTFEGSMVSGFRKYYPSDHIPDVDEVSDTYWHRYIYECLPDAVLEKNLSWSGSLVMRIDDSTYRDKHWFARYFYQRAAEQGFGNPDLLIVNGGTNDLMYQGGRIAVESDHTLAPGYRITGDVLPSEEEFGAWFGAADAATSPEAVEALPDNTFIQAYIKLLQLAKVSCKPGLKTILIVGDALNGTCSQSISRIAEHYGACVVDFYALNGNYLSPRDTTFNPIPKGSGCHPDAAGHAFMASYMWQQSKQYIKNK